MRDLDRFARLGLILGALVFYASCNKSFLAQYTFSGTCQLEGQNGTSVAAIAEDGSELIACEQEDVRFSWRINDYGVRLEIDNQSSTPVEIRWANGAFLDEAGQAHDLVATKGPVGRNVVETSVINAHEADVIAWLFPKSYAEQSKSRWQCSRTLFDPPGFQVGKKPGEMETIAAPVIGKSIGWRLPLNVNGLEQTIEFRFTVTKVEGRARWLS